MNARAGQPEALRDGATLRVGGVTLGVAIG